MLRIGIISDASCAFSKSISADATLYQFHFAKTDPSFSGAFDSAVSPPARYLEEIAVRLSLAPGANAGGGVLLFNPYYEFSRLHIAAALSAPFRRNTNCVLADRNGRPIGYFFNRPIADGKAHLLRLLSATDAELDATLISHLFTADAGLCRINSIEIDPHKSNGFNVTDAAVFEWMARRSLDLLQSGLRPGEDNITAVMPHHAGDAIFTATAFKRTVSPVKSVAINQSYAPIARVIDPELSIVSLPGHAYFREPNAPFKPVKAEWEYLLDIRGELPAEKFLIYMRPCRNYNLTSFHLVDHYAFALGRHFFDIRDSLVATLPAVQPPRPPDSRRALIHLDAGWPLKIYPQHNQQALIDLLIGAGFEVTVLAGKSGTSLQRCKVETFVSLEQLSELVLKQSIVIGMDSFPVHWASYALGVPALTLFGGTRKDNSHGLPNSPALSVDNGMSCTPCLAWDQCPAFGGNFCRNFITPAEVVNAITQVLQSAAAIRNPEPATKPAFTDSAPHFNFAENPSYELPTTLLRYRLLISRAGNSRYFNYPAGLVRRVVAEYKVRGLRATFSKAAFFLMRRLRRLSANR